MNEETENINIINLEQKSIELVNTSIALNAQGYIINKAKKTKLDWSSILIHAFENIKLFNRKQKNNIITIFNVMS